MIDATPGTPPPTRGSRDITSPRSDYGWRYRRWEHEHEDSTSPTGTPSRILLPSPELTARERSVQSAMRGRQQQQGQRARGTSDASMLSVDVGQGYWYVLIFWTKGVIGFLIRLPHSFFFFRPALLRDRTRSRDNSLDDPDAVHSPTTQRSGGTQTQHGHRPALAHTVSMTDKKG